MTERHHGALPVSSRLREAMAAKRRVVEYLLEGPYAAVWGSPDVYDFVLGNPQEVVLDAYTAALARQIPASDKNSYSYTMSLPQAQGVVAARLSAESGLPYEPADIAMTPGAFGAIAVALLIALDHGDEAIFPIPPWFNYENMIVANGGTPVKVPLMPETFDLDLDAIAQAVGERTRLVIITTPHNPTGRVYPPDQLRELARILAEASEGRDRPIWLLSDEPYRDLVFEGVEFHSPAEHYPHTLISYSYGKVLLTPGQRLGWLAITPTMAERTAMRAAVRGAQIDAGWMFASVLMQRALPDLDGLSIGMPRLQRKRDHMVAALRALGYEVNVPDGTFYLLPKSPLDDDMAFAELLAKHDVYVLPGTVCEIPGYFRISLTATEAMIDDSLAGFAAALEEATTLRG